MAIVVPAIHMSVAGFFALMAYRDHIVCDTFSYSLVENKIHPAEPAWKLLISDLAGVLYNATMEVMNIFKSFVLKIGACLFAANTSGAVHYNFFIFLAFQVFNHKRHLFPESVGIGTECTPLTALGAAMMLAAPSSCQS